MESRHDVGRRAPYAQYLTSSRSLNWTILGEFRNLQRRLAWLHVKPCGERSSVGRAPVCGTGCRGFKSRRSPHHFIYLANKSCGPLAQLVEQLTLNQRVVGSIPTRPTLFSSAYAILRVSTSRLVGA